MLRSFFEFTKYIFDIRNITLSLFFSNDFPFRSMLAMTFTHTYWMKLNVNLLHVEFFESIYVLKFWKEIFLLMGKI